MRLMEVDLTPIVVCVWNEFLRVRFKLKTDHHWQRLLDLHRDLAATDTRYWSYLPSRAVCELASKEEKSFDWNRRCMV